MAGKWIKTRRGTGLRHNADDGSWIILVKRPGRGREVEDAEGKSTLVPEWLIRAFSGEQGPLLAEAAWKVETDRGEVLDPTFPS